MQRSASFTQERSKQTPPSKIPTPSTRVNNGTSPTVPERPTSLLRRSASMRLPPVTTPGRNLGEREVWGIGSGSWGKRQQMRKQQGLDRPSRSAVTSPVSPRGLNSLSMLDKLNLKGNSILDDLDDDACSERSYDSTMSVDRAALRSKRFVVHCGSGQSDLSPTMNGATYLTPTQRAAQMNKELKARLRQALEDIASREREISRLTQECVELRMNQVRNRSSTSPDHIRSRTPSYIEKDSLNSSVHSNLEVPAESNSILSDREDVSPILQERAVSLEKHQTATVLQESHVLKEKEVNESISDKTVMVNEDCIPDGKMNRPINTNLTQHLTSINENSTKLEIQKPFILNGSIHQNGLKSLQDSYTQTVSPKGEASDLEEQLNAAKEALIETKGAQERRPDVLLSADEALLLWQQASLKVQLSRAKNAAGSSHAEVTLQFLKSAFFHLVTGSGQVTPAATRSHWKAIQSILGFTAEECKAMDNALATGSFPGGTW